MAELRRPRDSRAALDTLAAEVKADRTGAVLLPGASGEPALRTAETLAAAIGAKLVRVDLAAVASKYVGETEKNLGAVLKDAAASGAVLLIDDADALFGKGTDVKDSHDRYANIETNYLLERVESYPGLVVLATNSTSGITLKRRVRVVEL
jgi:vesicle-fusing ATPase